MFKYIFLSFFIFGFLHANDALQLSKHIINDSSANKKLKLLFQNRSFKDENGNLDLRRIINILRSNSLIQFNFNQAKELRLSFKSKADPTIFFKLLNDTLAKLGYVYFIPTELILDDKNITYKIVIYSQYILDPAIFYDYLKKDNIYIKDIRRTQAFDYEYTLDFAQAKLDPNISLELNQNTKLNKPLEDYIFELKNAKKIKITAAINDTWFPKILFLDKNLNLVLSIEEKAQKNSFEQLVPKEVKYAVVGDNFDLDNIKRGLSIELLAK